MTGKRDSVRFLPWVFVSVLVVSAGLIAAETFAITDPWLVEA